MNLRDFKFLGCQINTFVATSDKGVLTYIKIYFYKIVVKPEKLC